MRMFVFESFIKSRVKIESPFGILVRVRFFFSVFSNEFEENIKYSLMHADSDISSDVFGQSLRTFSIESLTATQEKWHQERTYVLLWIYQGSGRQYIDDQVYEIQEDQVWFVGPSQIHRWETKGIQGLKMTFSLDFMLDAVGPYQPGPVAANPPSSIDLCVVANEGDIFTIDTFGSDFDTELALFDQAGDLIVNNDDAVGLQSEVSTEIDATTAGLGACTYFFVVGGFNHVFDDGFSAVASSTDGTASGLIGGQINGIAFSGSVDVDSVQWYSFTVVPAPASAALLGLGGLAAARRRR